VNKWVTWLVILLGFHGLHCYEFKLWYKDNYLCVMLCLCLNEFHSLSLLLECIVW